MVLGIDEVGDFAIGSESFHYFIAVHLDQNHNGIIRKKNQFYQWLNTISDNKKNQYGEVKGKDLTDQELYYFAEKVIATNPPVRITQMRLIPKENPEDLVEEFKKIEISQYEKAVEYFANKNRPQVSEEYQKLIYWYKNRNYQQYIKIIMLNKTIPEALRNTIIIAIVLSEIPGSSHDNLLKIKIKIDRDFINGPQPRLFFGELLKHAFRTFTNNNPIPALDTWEKSGHPFLDKYLKSNGKYDFKEILYDNCNFCHSHEQFEIQMADITGNIIHRFQNRQRCKDAYEKLVEKFSNKKHEITHIRLNPHPNKGAGIIIEKG